MSENCPHARPETRHHGMGVRIACVFWTVLPGVTSPPTDDPIVPIVIAMVLSGTMMLGCIGFTLYKKLRQMRDKKERMGKYGK